MKCALYIDMDNFLGHCYGLDYPVSFEEIIDHIEKQGHKIVIKKSFGSIAAAVSHLDYFISMNEVFSLLDKNGITHVNCSGKKNTADLELSLDAILNINDYDIVYVVSSDTDFKALAHHIREHGAEMRFIRMFKPFGKEYNDVTYPEILGIEESNGAVILVYRDILERVLRFRLAPPDVLKEVAKKAVEEFKPGDSLTGLTEKVGLPYTQSILKTAFYGRAFISKMKYGPVLFGIRKNDENSPEESIRSAYYRQCEYVIRNNVGRLNEDALNETFRLGRGEMYSVSQRKLVHLEDAPVQ